MAVIKRRPPGHNGGRPVTRAFWFSPHIDGKYPSESESIRTNRLPDDPNMQVEDLWLVIPIDQEDEKRDVTRARASVWRTAQARKGLNVVSEYVKPNLYVTIAE